MSIENSFCLCDWKETVQLWNASDSEDEFAKHFFESEKTVEILFPEPIHLHFASWEMLEDFSDWYRGRTFAASKDWDHFCAACKSLGLMETEPYQFQPVNELVADDDDKELEILFGALPPESVKTVREHLLQIDGSALDKFISEHELIVNVPFSQLVDAMAEALDPEKGLIIFAG